MNLRGALLRTNSSLHSGQACQSPCSLLTHYPLCPAQFCGLCLLSGPFAQTVFFVQNSLSAHPIPKPPFLAWILIFVWDSSDVSLTLCPRNGRWRSPLSLCLWEQTGFNVSCDQCSSSLWFCEYLSACLLSFFGMLDHSYTRRKSPMPDSKNYTRAMTRRVLENHANSS